MMRRLSPPPGPHWETLVPADGKVPAVELLFAPIGPKARKAAGRASLAVRDAAPAEIAAELNAFFSAETSERASLSADAIDLLEDMGRASTDTFLRLGIVDWKGIGGPDRKDKVLAVTPETVEWLIADEDLRARAEAVYVAPDAARLAEKNGSSASSNGTSKEAMPDSATVSKAAAPTRKADVSRTRKPAKGAARISSTNAARIKVKPSGKSSPAADRS